MMVRHTTPDRATEAFGLFALSGSSVIASPYRDRDGRVVGVVGVIGPTRLNYARVVPMVDFTAQTLSKMRALGKIIG